ncbi:MAG: helix-turn-helix transcriptional regulator [Verrucomicrobiales bacterium]
MPLFSRRAKPKPNRADSSGAWPLIIEDWAMDEAADFRVEEGSEITLVLDGEFALEAPGAAPFPMVPGAALVAHPGSSYRILEARDARLVRLRFLPEWLAGKFDAILESPDVLGLFFAPAWFGSKVEGATPFLMNDGEGDYALADLAAVREEVAAGRGRGALCRIAFTKLLLHTGRAYGAYFRGRRQFHLRPEIVRVAVGVEGLILRGLPLHLKELSERCGLSQDHLGRVFRKEVGTTIVDFAQRRRAQHAARLILSTEDSGAAIAESLGYTDAAHFTKSFIRYHGMAPQAYRERYAGTTATRRRRRKRSRL